MSDGYHHEDRQQAKVVNIRTKGMRFSVNFRGLTKWITALLGISEATKLCFQACQVSVNKVHASVMFDPDPYDHRPLW